MVRRILKPLGRIVDFVVCARRYSLAVAVIKSVSNASIMYMFSYKKLMRQKNNLSIRPEGHKRFSGFLCFQNIAVV